MKRSSWLRKMLWMALVALILVLGGGLMVLRSYLSSAAVTQQVAQRLQEMLGGRVEIQSAHIGFVGDSSVHGIEVYEEGKADKPWLRIDAVTADVSALSLLRDRSPQDIHLQDVRAHLRFDSEGRLLTKLPTKKKTAPAQLPSIHVDRGELTFDQEHRSPMIIRGVHADLVSASNGLTLSGTVNDPFWGDWKAKGSFNEAGSQGNLTLDTENVAVTMTKLKSIPFVPSSIWQEVQFEGSTPAQLGLSIETKGDKTSVHYRAQISPRSALVRVPSIDLEAVEVNGKATIADEIVELENATGKVAGGSITASGKANFHDEPTHLSFKAGVQDVVLHDLPHSWHVPDNIDGKLTGSADLVVTIERGKIETAGTGDGLIRDANWSGFPIEKPVRLTLRSENGRFRFHQPEPAPLAKTANAEVRQERSNYPEPDRRSAVVQAAKPERQPDRQAANPEHEKAASDMVNLLGRGIKSVADGLAKGIDSAANALGKLKPPSKPGESPTYLDVDLNLQNVDLAQLVQKLKLDLPYPITGRLTFQIHASIPINTAGDLKAYRLRGTANLTTFNVDGLAMTNVEAKVRYTEGILDLEKLSGQMPTSKAGPSPGAENEGTGKFDGDARVQVAPRGDVLATLKLNRLPLSKLLSLVPQTPKGLSGVLSGTVQARAPLMKLNDPASWRGAANLSVPNVEVFGLSLRDVSANLIVDETRARLTTLKANFEGAPLTGQGELSLQGSYSFKAEVRMTQGDLTSLNRLAPAFRPPFQLKGNTQLEGNASGTLKPLRFDTSGQIHARDLVVERFTVDDVSFRWSRDNNDLKLEAIKAELYGGQVTGSARLPLTATAPGGANLDVRNLNVQAMAKALPTFPVRLEGKISGTVTGKLSPAVPDQPRTWTSDIEVSAPQLRVQGIPAEKLKGTIDSRAGKTSYNLQGETLGGTFTLKGDLPLPAKEAEKKQSHKDPADLSTSVSDASQKRPMERRFSEASQIAYFADEQPVGSGRFELRDARLARLWRAYNITGGLAHLKGRFSIVLNYRHVGPSLTPVGSGTFRIINIRWDDDYLGSSLQGSARLTANSFDLYNVTGDVADGLFQGQFSFGLRENSRGSFQIDLQQVEASRLLAPLPEVARHVKGPADVDLRGSIGPEWAGGGGVTLTRALVYGMSITEWRIPLTFSFSPSQGSGELALRDSQARLAQGRARFDSTLNWGNGLRLSGLLHFFQVDMRTLLRSSPELTSYVSGRVTGRVDLSGSEMRSLNDLRALVQVKMEQGQALQMPVLRQITPYLRPGVSIATFQTGELKGRLAGGIFRIEHATLVGDFVKMLILGTITLAGNLNLEVTAQTGLYCFTQIPNSLLSRIPIVGAIPRIVLYEVSTLLAAAVVHLMVTGTVSAPVIRIQPLVLLTEEAIRFFLGRALGLPIPNLP